MTRKTKEDTAEPKEEAVTVEAAPVPKKVVSSRPIKVKFLTFDQYTARIGTPHHHKGGLRAFCSDANVPKPLAVWDKIFETY